MITYTPSGSASISDKKSFRFFDQMQFLNDSITSRASISNVSKEPELVNDNLDTNDCSTMQEPREHDESSFVDSQMFEEDNINESISGIGRSVSRTSSISSHEKRRKTQSGDAEFRRD